VCPAQLPSHRPRLPWFTNGSSQRGSSCVETSESPELTRFLPAHRLRISPSSGRPEDIATRGFDVTPAQPGSFSPSEVRHTRRQAGGHGTERHFVEEASAAPSGLPAGCIGQGESRIGGRIVDHLSPRACGAAQAAEASRRGRKAGSLGQPGSPQALLIGPACLRRPPQTVPQDTDVAALATAADFPRGGAA
jgi:hypothetical protein